MLSLNDLMSKKVLFIMSEDFNEDSIRFHNSNIVLYRGGKIKSKVSLHLVLCIFVLGDLSISSVLIKSLKKFGISLFLLNSNLNLYAEVLAYAEGNYLLRQKQYTTDREAEFLSAKKLISNKLLNQYILQKHLKADVSEELFKEYQARVISAENEKILLGLEGAYSSLYFKSIFKDYFWYRRAPRTREDISNFMLDIGYTYLFNFVDSVLHLFGFDTYKGFYHKLYFNRKSLSCDIMEPFRYLVDQQLIKSYNLKQIDPKDFVFKNQCYDFKEFSCNKKYSEIWLDLIVDNKQAIYNYILDYYRYLQNPGKYKFPIHSKL